MNFKIYRLQIKYDEITKDNFDFVNRIRQYDGESCTQEDGIVIFKNGDSIGFGKILQSWLIKIKYPKKPLTFEEWDMRQSYEGQHIYHQRERTWNASIENHKLEQIVDTEKDNSAFNDYLNNIVEPFNSYYVLDTWNAALKYVRGER